MEIKKILVGIDRDTMSDSPVFERAIRLAEKEGARIRLFHCLPQDTVAELEDRVGAATELNQSGGFEKRDSLRKHDLEHVRAWLDGLGKTAEERGVPFKSVVEVGNAGRQMVEHANAWGADLIVVGRTRRSALRDILVGSVSNHVLHAAECSVFFVY